MNKHFLLSITKTQSKKNVYQDRECDRKSLLCSEVSDAFASADDHFLLGEFVECFIEELATQILQRKKVKAWLKPTFLVWRNWKKSFFAERFAPPATLSSSATASASSWTSFLDEALIPAARMLMSTRPVEGSTADCFNASLCRLNED